ncbi:MAG: UDP-N-acetylmuramoyl-L-alanine--D-glutamate ligase, partial [Patescibacteria group bacterium]
MKNQGRIAIIGFGVEGRALFFYLKRQGERDITILDQNKKLALPRGANAITGPRYLRTLSDFDVIYRSPGTPYYLPHIQKVREKVSSSTNLFFTSAQGTIIGVTGSAGKSTTAALIYRILKAGGRQVFLGGNIGKNPLQFIERLTPQSITVLELSSFQLQNLKKSPHIAVVLDVYEEHLDKHKSLKGYLDAKTNIGRFQKPGDAMIFSKDSPFSGRIAAASRGKKFSFSLADTHTSLYREEDTICDTDGKETLPLGEIKLPGAHNIKNVMAAFLAARAAGAKPGIIRKAIKSFRGLPHRLEFVRKVGGITFYNDSGAVNIGAAIASMDAFAESKVALVGGKNKNLPLMPLAARLSHPDVRCAVLFGEIRQELGAMLKKRGMKNFFVEKTMERAVRNAAGKAMAGDIVLLAPGTASFDAFK